ncbi:MAG: SAM-dependent methyltransferase, partial [Clostridia bacterium]|nr:SAM-dependent methyltransferase [Clostridia bacterium]
IIKHVSGKKIADIGTDHAYIPIYLTENGLADFVIASDINKGPRLIAEDNIKNHGLTEKTETRLGGGLSVLKEGEADTIIIAGMGGILISEIIDADIEIAKKSNLILQPMNAQYELRKYLLSHGFKIINEDIAVEGFKVYNLIEAASGEQQPFENDFEYHVPHYLTSHKYFKNLYNKKHREFTKVIKGLENSNEPDTEKLNQYKNWLKELEKYEG